MIFYDPVILADIAEEGNPGNPAHGNADLSWNRPAAANRDTWKPRKYVHKRGSLMASRDTDEVSP